MCIIKFHFINVHMKYFTIILIKQKLLLENSDRERDCCTESRVQHLIQIRKLTNMYRISNY